MDTFIEAETARLAGLQIDLLHKVRKGQVTLDQVEWLLNLRKDVRERLKRSVISKPNPLFTLVDAFELVVPVNYHHDIQLRAFRKSHTRQKFGYNDAVNDNDCAQVTTKLEPSQKYVIKIFQMKEPIASPEGCMEVLQEEGIIFTGAQGLSLVYEKSRAYIEADCRYFSFDRKDALPKWHATPKWHADCPGVPYIAIRKDESFFSLYPFDDVIRNGDRVVCFCKEW